MCVSIHFMPKLTTTEKLYDVYRIHEIYIYILCMLFIFSRYVYSQYGGLWHRANTYVQIHLSNYWFLYSVSTRYGIFTCIFRYVQVIISNGLNARCPMCVQGFCLWLRFLVSIMFCLCKKTCAGINSVPNIYKFWFIK